MSFDKLRTNAVTFLSLVALTSALFAGGSDLTVGTVGIEKLGKSPTGCGYKADPYGWDDIQNQEYVFLKNIDPDRPEKGWVNVDGQVLELSPVSSDRKDATAPGERFHETYEGPGVKVELDGVVEEMSSPGMWSRTLVVVTKNGQTRKLMTLGNCDNLER